MVDYIKMKKWYTNLVRYDNIYVMKNILIMKTMKSRNKLIH